MKIQCTRADGSGPEAYAFHFPPRRGRFERVPDVHDPTPAASTVLYCQWLFVSVVVANGGSHNFAVCVLDNFAVGILGLA